MEEWWHYQLGWIKEKIDFFFFFFSFGHFGEVGYEDLDPISGSWGHVTLNFSEIDVIKVSFHCLMLLSHEAKMQKLED